MAGKNAISVFQPSLRHNSIDVDKSGLELEETWSSMRMHTVGVTSGLISLESIYRRPLFY